MKGLRGIRNYAQDSKKSYSLTCWFLQWVFIKHLLLLSVRKCKGPRVKRRMALSRDWEQPGGCRRWWAGEKRAKLWRLSRVWDLSWGRSGWLLHFTSNVSCITYNLIINQTNPIIQNNIKTPWEAPLFIYPPSQSHISQVRGNQYEQFCVWIFKSIAINISKG